MKRWLWKSMVFVWPLVILFAAEAGAGPADHPSAKQRRETFEASRHADEQTRVKPNTALLRAIEKLKQARKNPDGTFPPVPPVWRGELPPIWDAPQCQRGWTEGSPGLVTREGWLPAGASQPLWGPSYQYDRHGNVTVHSWGLGSPNWFKEECAYEDRGDLHSGKLVYKREDSTNWTGPVYHITYNERGQIALETEDILKRDGTVDHRLYIRYVYDAAGYLLEQNLEWDEPLGGKIDYQSALILSHNEKGQYTRMVLGYYDVPGGTFFPYRTNEYSREAEIEYRDYDLDGVADQWSKAWYSYDDHNHVIRILTEYDDYGRADGGADGVVDSRRLEQFDYDIDGNLVRQTYENPEFEPSSWPWREEWLYTYNARGWLTNYVYHDDEFIDGINDITIAWTIVRDPRGKPIEYLSAGTTVWSSPHIGHSRYVNVYDGIGNLIEQMATGWSDDDPPPPFSGALVYGYTSGRSGQTGSRTN